MKPRRVAGVVDHRAPDAAPGVVLAQLDRIGAADHALLGPVELMRAGLVRDPVLVGVPERPGLDDHDPPTVARETLGEHRAPGAGADDDQINLVGFGVARHRVLAGQIPAVDVQQVARVVVARSDRTLQDSSQT